MGGKKKSVNKQQEKPKGQANGSHDRAPSNSQQNRSPSTSTPVKGKDKQGKNAKPGQDSSRRSPSSSSLPESRLPWRLILLVSILAGGVAIVCVNEPARSVIEDVYLRHIQPQVLRASEGLSSGLAAMRQSIQGDSAPGSPRPEENQQTEPPQTESKPVESPSGNRAKKDTPTSTPPPTVTTTAPPPPSPDTKSETPSQGERDRKEAAEQGKQTDQSENVQGKKTRSEEPKTEKDTKKKPDRQTEAGEKETPKKERQDRTPETTGEKTVPVDTPTPDPERKQEIPTQPVVEEIRVRTTPKAGKGTPDDNKSEKQTEEPTQAAQKPQEKQNEKPEEKQTGKSSEKLPKKAEKPLEKDEKPAQKPVEKPDSKPVEKPAQKPVEKEEKQAQKPAEKEEKPAQKPAEKDEKRAPKTTEKDEKRAPKPVEKDEKPAPKPTEKDEKPAPKPTEKDEKPAQKSTEKEEKPAQKPTQKEEKSAQKPTQKEEKPAPKSTEKPAQKPTQKEEKPAPKSTEKEEKPAQKPTQKEEKPAPKSTEKEEKPPQKPTKKEEKPAPKSTEKEEKPQKPTQKEEKSAPKPTEKDEKPAQKPTEKPDPKRTEKPDAKPGEKADQKRKVPEEQATSGRTDGTPVPQKSSKPAADNSAKSPGSDYAKASITNKADFKIREKLDEAEDLLQEGDLQDALQMYDEILRKHPKSPRAQLGRADTLDAMAFKRKSNEVLEQSILGYERLIYHGEDVMPDLMKLAGRRLVKKQQFRGWGAKAAKTLEFLVEKFPEDLSLQREEGVSHLMVGQNEEARRVFQKMLKNDPEDGFAQVHLGFIVKNTDNNPAGAVPLLQAGIDSEHEGTQDGRFFFHLGDAYHRLGRPVEARRIYQRGADKGLFLSADQRSLYNIKSLKSRPWWTKEQTGYQEFLKLLEKNWQTIRDEGLQQLDSASGFFKPEAESLREKGDWKQLTMYQQGRQNKKVCDKVPKTCALIEQIPDAKGCKRGQVKFSVMQPGTHVWPHCGPTNCRIRAHLGLVVPKGPEIRVVNETRTWKEGEFIIFDDSFEHEVWHNGNSVRLVLIVDFWHPDLTEAEKRSLVPI